ncbi:MAG TPA: hypothetical protein VED63_12630 [Acidimicrobiales bacterium]|nr:hypothetical protein [Acidimicrobiales bacterium]
MVVGEDIGADTAPARRDESLVAPRLATGRAPRLAPRVVPRLVALVRRRAPLVLALLGLVALLLVVPERPVTQAALPTPKGITAPAAPGSPGTSVAGVACGPGIRQVPWSSYAPICQPAWHGDNGGATAPGVTATTITLTYRLATTDELQELYALVPPAVVGTNSQAVHTMQAYINTFNRYYELYGRKVVLKPYAGEGNFIDEVTGSGLAEAQSDALTVATSLNGFADMSLVDSTVTYTEALQDHGVVAFGSYLQDADWYRSRAPDEQTVGPNCTKSASAIGAVLGNGLSDTRAIYAGDPTLRAENRVYGIIYPDNSTATTCARLIESALAAHHHASAVNVSFTFDPATLIQSSSNAVAQMRSHHVTTVICASCDPVTPIFLFIAAHGDGYRPEWFLQSYFAGGTSNLDNFVANELAEAGTPDEAGGILTLGNAPVPWSRQEAVEAYRLGNGGSTVGLLPSYLFAYEPLLDFFNLLQAAGPDLTDHRLQAAMADTASLAPSAAPGEFGLWVYGDGVVDPSASYSLLRWSPTTISTLDGKMGSMVACYGGRVFTYAAVDSAVPAHREPGCPS